MHALTYNVLILQDVGGCNTCVCGPKILNLSVCISLFRAASLYISLKKKDRTVRHRAEEEIARKNISQS